MSDAQRESRRRWREANKAKHAESNRRWRTANPEKRAEYERRWRAENPERRREINRESEKRRSARRRIQEAKRARDRARYAENRDEMRDRARRFREAHPERVREYQRRWVQKDPERARALSRSTGETYRDRHGDQVRERGRAAAAARRERDPDTFKNWYEQNLEAERARGRSASQLRSRLKKLGLPPRRITRVYAEQKRANEKNATEFFSRRRDAASIRLISVPDQGHLIRERSSEIPRRNLEQRAAADNFLLRLPRLVQVEHERHGERIRSEVEMDNAARIHAGKDPYDITREVNRRVLRAIVDQHAPPGAHERVAELGALMRAKTVPGDSAERSPALGAAASLPSGEDRVGSEYSVSQEAPAPSRPRQPRM